MKHRLSEDTGAESRLFLMVFGCLRVALVSGRASNLIAQVFLTETSTRIRPWFSGWFGILQILLQPNIHKQSDLSCAIYFNPGEAGVSNLL